MSRHFSHLNTAKQIVQQYNGGMPLSAWLKNFFSKQKKYGSRDRRSILALCYNYYRIGASLNHLPIEERLLAGLFLITTEPSEHLADQRPVLNEKIQLPLHQKVDHLGIKPKDVFPYNHELSKEINVEAFNHSFLIQPKLFIRIRPGRQLLVEKKLAAADTQYVRLSETCLAFENGTKIEAILETNRDYVVQDYNSQQTFSVLPTTQSQLSTINVWDCCAASGGKSIMAADVFKNIQLTVSDVRLPIINNLHQRFKQAGVKNYHSFIADLTEIGIVKSKFPTPAFDIVIYDAPCSGSGTWSRTPEQLAFFKASEIERYSQLQKKIARNVITAIKKKGYLLYITCSVFKKENEDVVDYLQTKYPVKLLQSRLLKGYEAQADSMFAALLQVN